jgi:signal transduction histidine kinase/CheY-like chemotaxis protein
VQLLTEQRDAIVSRFVAEVARKTSPPPGASRSLLIDHIPIFLDEIVAELAPGESLRISLDAVDTSETARQHGAQRWALGFELEMVVREYGILRHCILQVARAHGVQLSIDEFDALAKCLNVGVAEAVTEYVAFGSEQLKARQARLEFVAEAGQLLSSSLDYRSTLSRLTALLVPRMADWCAIHLDGVPDSEMPIAHVDPAKEELLRRLFTRFPSSEGSQQGHLHVAQTGEALLAAVVDKARDDESAHGPEHLALLRALGTRSSIIVPLKIQTNVFGALMLAYSDSERHYDASDLVLAEDLARRSAVAIDNARLFESVQKERSRAEAATRAKDEFIAMISHELRTPLNAMLGWVRLMRTGSLPEARQRHAFEVIERNANAQSQLVNDLLEISGILAGKMRIKPAQVDVLDVLEMAVEGVRPAADAKSIQLDVENHVDSALLRGDAERLQQVFWNLLTNAVKFTPKKGRVKATLRKVDSELELSVEDNGLGIAQAFLPHVFDSFRQSDTTISRTHGGLGLGLSISKHIVELHGGTIEARSAGVGQGAAFVVRLPVSPLVSATFGVPAVPATREPASAAPAGTSLAGVRVLVVDDEPDARELLAYFLESCEAEVRVAESVGEALSVLEGYTPDVIVSDIGMPVEDGYAFIRRVRTLPAESKQNIPAIALTAFTRHEDRTRALVEGFNVHMAKPVEPAALAKAIRELADALGSSRPAR